jgi:hypothetical protein
VRLKRGEGSEKGQLGQLDRSMGDVVSGRDGVFGRQAGRLESRMTVRCRCLWWRLW